MSTISNFAQRWNKAYASTETRATFQDCLFLVSVISVSFMLYLPALGFYSDDWIFLSLLHLSEDQSLGGLYQALYAGDIVIRQRPLQMVYLVVFYWLFGLEPVYYHLANAVALIANGILLYLSVRGLRQSRWIAVVVPLVYLLLPHYSTDRLWIAAHQATFSISFYLLSLYADIRALQAYPLHWRWKLVGSLALLLSGLSYEVAIPLFLLNPFLVWYGSSPTDRTASNGEQGHRKFLRLFAANFLAFALILVFKALVTVRTNVEADLFSHLVFLITGAARVNFVTYGLGLPYLLAWIASHQPNWMLIAVTAVIWLFVFRYLYSLAPQADSDFSETKKWRAFILLGLIVFALGYSIFVLNADLWFTSTSLGNRIAIAGAIGVALVFVGAAGWVTNLLPKRWTRAAFCFLISMLVSSGFLIINTLASFWISAYHSQQEIVKDIQKNVPGLSSGSTLILDGVCLERGGAYLFTGKRDLTSALWIAYRDPGLNATVLSSSPQIADDGLSVLTYKRSDFYPYAGNLFIYNAAQKELHSLSDANAAREYFERTDFVPERDCPPGFAWGWNEQR